MVYTNRRCYSCFEKKRGDKMGLTYSFMDNSSYGADDINKVFSKLTTQGVSLFNYSDGDNPLISLNEAVSNFVNPGIENFNPEACKVLYTPSEKENTFGNFNILRGNAFMYDGAIITVDDDGYDISDEVRIIRQTSENDIYVYFYRNVPNNSVDVCVTVDDSLINAKETVILAKISGSDNVFDMRRFATTKVAPCSANVVIFGETNGFDLYRTDTGRKRLRMVIKDVFPGAKYVSNYSTVIPIQEVETENGEELEYTIFPQYDEEIIWAAFNRVGTDIEVWIYSEYSYYTQVFSRYFIF